MNLSLRSTPLFIAILICAVLSPALAQQKKFPTYTGHVNDFANIIDQETRHKLELWLTNFENMTGTQIAVVTVKSLEGQSSEEYANELYRAWGIGAKTGEQKDKGALLLVAVQDRKTRLEVGYGLEGDLPDGLAGEIIRRMRPGLQQGRYSEGMTTGVRTLLDTLAEKWNINIAGIEDRRYAYRAPDQPPQLRSGASLICLIVGIIIFFLLISALSRSRRRGGGGRGGPGAGDMWWLYPIIFNRGGGTFGGGSWGNTGGWGNNGGWNSGGWGGFGGGSSGGGGASDSW
ncbi:MAG TPA: TPM domain-containing protein [Blastocatellia bacterium]|nr:TPM domain-containing protein [Blastocatellia bacterium]